MSIFSRPKEEEQRESIFRDNSINKILDQMVSDGELPPSQKVLAAIRENKITAEDAKAKWTAFKKGQDQIVGNEQGEINKPIDQKDVFKDDLNYFAKNENKPSDPPPEQKLAMPGQPPEPEKPFKTIGLTGAIEELGYIAKKYLSGLSMGLYEPEQDSPSTMASIAGTIANITGFAGPAMLGGIALRSVPVIGGAIKSLETGSKAAGAAMQASKLAGEGVKASVFAAKHGKALGALAAEAAPLGFAVGATKAKIQGQDWDDAFAAGVVDSAVWTGGAALFYPLVAGVVSLAGLRETRKLGKVYKHLSEDEIATRFKGMKVDDMLDLLEKVPEGERSEQMNKALIALKKVKVTDPEGGVLSATEFAKTPEISSSVLEAKSKEMVDSIYGDGPLKFMMENNPTLKSMYANKRYVDILSSTDGFLHEQVKNRNSIGDLAALPFLSDADTLASTAAKSAMRRAQRKGIAGVDEDMFTEFFKDPSKANLDPLKQAIPASKDLRQVMGVAPRTFAQGKKGLTDIRVTSEDAAKIVNDHLETYYRAVATDGAISFGDIGKLAASNEIMRTATVMNKNFSRRMVEAHARKLDTNNMVFVKPELKQGVDAKILINATVQDASHDVRLLKSAKEALKSAKTEAAALIEDVGKEEGADMAKEIVSTAQKNMKNVSARLASKNKKIRQLESELLGYEPETLAEIDKLVGEIYAPNKALMGMQTKETTAFLQRFGYQDNPLYVRNGSELAEQLSMMQAAGKDIGFGKVVEGQFKNERWLESLTKPINVTYFAPIVRKIRTHLGYNSPLEVMFNRIKENDVRVKQGYEYYMNELGSTGLAKGTQADKVARRLGKAEITTSSEEFLALTPKNQQQVLDAVGKARVMLDELHMVANAERSRMGQKLIAYKDNYIPDIHRKEGFFKAVGERLSTTSEDVSSEIGRVGRKGGLNRPDRPDVRQVHMMHQGGKGDYYDGLIEAYTERHS
jgi:hypothetical protein